jgi:hypothetical protein
MTATDHGTLPQMSEREVGVTPRSTAWIAWSMLATIALALAVVCGWSAHEAWKWNKIWEGELETMRSANEDAKTGGTGYRSYGNEEITPMLHRAVATHNRAMTYTFVACPAAFVAVVSFILAIRGHRRARAALAAFAAT